MLLKKEAVCYDIPYAKFGNHCYCCCIACNCGFDCPPSYEEQKSGKVFLRLQLRTLCTARNVPQSGKKITLENKRAELRILKCGSLV